MQALWQPGKHRIEQALITRFQQQLQLPLAGDDYQALHRWSIEQREAFWSALWDFAGIIGDKGSAPFLEHGERFPGSRWFPAARLNYAENLLRRRDQHTALVSWLENGQRDSITYAALYQRVASLAAAMRKEGVVPGDRIAGYLPNIIDTVVAMLAANSIGAVWSSCSPDFGEQGLLDRFGQIEPVMLFAADGYFYNGKPHDSLARVEAIVPALPSLRRVVIIPVLNAAPAITGIPQAVLIENYLDHSASDCQFEQLPFDHPQCILYSSGTTGKPKCIVHGIGGVLLEHQKEHLLHTDISAEEVFFYYSTCGWMMWNWQVSALATGCTLVLYDGSPAYPEADSLLALIDKENISIFGTSAKYLAALEKAGCQPAAQSSFPSLKTLLSTGSPLAPESYHYVYQQIKSDLLLSSIAGGTDILGAFASGHPCLPVYAGELQCIGLGFDLDVVNDEGQSLRGAKGEMICRQSFPSVPLGFWNDSDGQRFHDAYFARFDNIWTHGDYAEITERHGLIIHGRSDALLNPGGVRIGTAEIYRQVEKVDAVVEALAVGQDWQDDCRVVLFVRLREGVQLDASLAQAIRQVIRSNTTPRHVPAKIIQVADLPRTLSGKIAELAVRKMIHGEPVNNREALANPQSLDLFKNLGELAQ